VNLALRPIIAARRIMDTIFGEIIGYLGRCLLWGAALSRVWGSH
jgi:hypothetical protein